MLVQLSARGLRPTGQVSASPFIARVSEAAGARGPDEILRASSAIDLPSGFRAYLVDEQAPGATPADTYVLPPALRYLSDGDVVRIDPIRRSLSALYRRRSRHNTLLVTERCDNYCTMCSQPPRAADDSWLADDALRVIDLMSPETEEVGITGGEPALLGPRLVEIVRRLAERMPRTAVHLLSNGRRFSDERFAASLAEVAHPDLMVGIPVYSDLPEHHDFVVQAKGAFEETLRGILNLKQRRVPVEIRFVIHRDTIERLPQFAEFVARNLLFVDHVALMGLEPTGFAKTNLDALWVEPTEYAPQLETAVRTLARAGAPVSVYNQALCLVPRNVAPFARPSISDWKNLYFSECDDCGKRSQCSGFFASSASRRPRGIHPFPHERTATIEGVR